MSFGFGVGDFLAVGQLSWKIYKKCKESSGNYTELSGEVLALHGVIKETEELLSQQDLTPEQKVRVTTCRQGCEEVLKDLQGLLAKYESLGKKSQRTFDRMGFGMQDINALRLRLISNISMLDAFNNNSSHARLENKLNQLINEVRSGKREGSIVSSNTFDQDVQDYREIWEALRRELEDIGISPSIIVEKQHFIIKWFQEAVTAGKLEEDAPSELDDSVIVPHGVDNAAEQYLLPNPGFGKNNSKSDNAPAEEMSSMMITQRSPKEITIREPLPQTKRSSPWSNREFHRPPSRKTERLGVSYLLSMLRGKTRVFLAASQDGDVAKIEELLGKGVKVGVQDADGNTALHLAAEAGNVVMIRLLIEKGASIEAAGYCRETALYIAAKEGHTGTVQLLLDKGANIETRDLDAQTALIRAAREGLVWTVKLLLERGAEIKSRDRNEDTALIWAAMKGSDSIVRLLLERGADIESRGFNEETALIQASREGLDPTVQLLLERGADVESKCLSGHTALIWAVSKGFHSTVQLLLKGGADTERKSSKGNTPLIIAAEKDFDSIIQLLLDAGANIESKSSEGDTALTLAARYCYSTAPLLIERGADIDAKGWYGYTALIWAIRNIRDSSAVLRTEMDSTVRLLLEKGAKTNIRGNQGATARSIAEYYGRGPELQRLKELGAKL